MPEQPFGNAPIDLIPSLREVIEADGLDTTHPLVAGLPNDGKETHRQRTVFVVANDKACIWEPASLRELFRGNRVPPPNIDRFPPEYAPYFYFVEKHLLMFCQTKSDRTDQEMEEVYSTLRRRPDAKSLGEVHDYLWQVAALLLGSHVLSQAEFEAIFGALAASARRWAQRPISRNYVGYLRQNF